MNEYEEYMCSDENCLENQFDLNNNNHNNNDNNISKKYQ